MMGWQPLRVKLFFSHTRHGDNLFSTELIIILLTLGVYRIAYDLARMDGPFNLYEMWRSFFVNRFGIGHWITEGVTCPICLSFWIAVPAAGFAVWLLGVSWYLYFMIWLGIAGAALALVRWTVPK